MYIGLQYMRHGIHVSSSISDAEIGLRHAITLHEMEGCLENIIKNCNWVQPHRYTSFAPMRPAVGRSHVNIVEHLVDGKETFEAMLVSLQETKKELFIAGWWISPDHHLQRPVNEHPESKLDLLLGNLANRGVQVLL